MSFVHLNAHSTYSLLMSAMSIESMVSKAKEHKQTHLALTDLGNLYGALEFYQEAHKQGIQPIIGLDAYIILGNHKDRKHEYVHHITLLAKNNMGLKNLYKLVTISNFDGFYFKPRIDFELLNKFNEGLIAMSSNVLGVPGHTFVNQEVQGAIDQIRLLHEIFKDRLFLEISKTESKHQEELNQFFKDIGQKEKISLVATNPCFYLEQSDAKAHDILLCIGTGKKVFEKDRLKFDSDQYYLKSSQEMQEVLIGYEDAYKNTQMIANACDVSFDLKNYHMPKYDLTVGQSPQDELKKLAKMGFEKRWPLIAHYYKLKNENPDDKRHMYEERLNRELNMIEQTGFPGYFLIVQDFINYAKSNNIPVGPGRGSAAGSLVAYATGITDIDPIPYQLLFERFLNPERISMPDIDVDFCQDGRDRVIVYVANKYNQGAHADEIRVAQIATFGKLQARAVIRDVGRTMGLSYGEVDRIAKLVPNVLNISLEEAFTQEPKFDELRKSDPMVDELLSVAISLEGLTRHSSVHAAGVVISDEQALVTHMPIAKGQHDEIVTQWDMKCVEKIGLVKFDFLGLKTLTLLARAVEMIKQSSNVHIELLAINENDKKVLDILSNGHTQGVFQLESSGMRDLVVKLKPSSFEDLIALVALYRPGPLGSGMVDDFINRKHGKTSIVYELKELEPILKDTYGVILYQEQVMQIASALANYSMGEADLLRRAMGKKIPEEMEKQESRFMDGTRKNNINEIKAKRIFDLMAKFAGYGFNKSHSAAYALISYQTAYLKAYYPIEFMAACLSIDKSNTDRVVMHMYECRTQNIEVVSPNVNKSTVDFHVEDKKIIFGLAAVKNVGELAVQNIVHERNQSGPFKDLRDFCERVDARLVNKKVLEALIKCGAFDFSGVKRAQMLSSLDQVMALAASVQKDKNSGQNSLFGAGVQKSLVDFKYENVEEWPMHELLRQEKESLGFYVSGHPLNHYMDKIKHFSNVSSMDLIDMSNQSTARMTGVVSNMKEITTKKGLRMAFVTLEDLTGKYEVIVFSDVYQKYFNIFKSEEPLYIVGKVDRDEDQVKILLEKAVPLERAWELFDGQMSIELDGKKISEDQWVELKKTLKAHPGQCKVKMLVNLENESKTVLTLDKKYDVLPTDNLIHSLNHVLKGVGIIEFY